MKKESQKTKMKNKNKEIERVFIPGRDCKSYGGFTIEEIFKKYERTKANNKTG
jgi:hypothetical protein